MVQNIDTQKPESTEQPHIPHTMSNGQPGNPHQQVVQTQNQAQATNQTNLATVDENSCEAAPQTEIPPSPAINGVVQVPLTGSLANGHMNGMANGLVNNEMLEEANGVEEQANDNDESLNLHQPRISTRRRQSKTLPVRKCKLYALQTNQRSTTRKSDQTTSFPNKKYNEI